MTFTMTHSRTLAVVMCAALMTSALTRADAQDAKPLQHAPSATKSKRLHAPFGATEVISSDGKYLAHFGQEHPAALYVKNVITGEDKLVAKGVPGPADWMVVDGLSFSPDGSRLVFECASSLPRKYVGKVYSVRTDGNGSGKCLPATKRQMVAQPA